MKLKDKFSIRITEQDRQRADWYCNNDNCLVATALKRRGYKKVREGVNKVTISRRTYYHRPLPPTALHVKVPMGSKAPFYDKEVVGLRITFTRQPCAS